jgi:hypothetical protein
MLLKLRVCLVHLVYYDQGCVAVSADDTRGEDLKSTTEKNQALAQFLEAGLHGKSTFPVLQAKAKKVRNKYSYVGTLPFSS